MYRIGFIGMGSMGSAMLDGCLSIYSKDQIIFSEKDRKRAEVIAAEKGVTPAAGNRECVSEAGYIVLAIKPQFYEEVLSEIKDCISKDKIIISIAPGYSIGRLKSILGEDVRIVRAMPNTPARVLEGMTGAVISDDDYTEKELNDIREFFTSFGKVEFISEKLIDAVTAASGSSPAFVYMMIEALADGVVACGMPRDMAYTFVAQSVLGSAKMVIETGKHPGELKDAVCSPAGTTIDAVRCLEKNGFRSSLMEAAVAVYEKCKGM